MAKKKAAKKAAKRTARKAVRKAPAKKTARGKSGQEAPAISSASLAKAFSEVYAPPPQLTLKTVTLDHDVAPHFRSDRAVNEALRALLRIVRQLRN